MLEQEGEILGQKSTLLYRVDYKRLSSAFPWKPSQNKPYLFKLESVGVPNERKQKIKAVSEKPCNESFTKLLSKEFFR